MAEGQKSKGKETAKESNLTEEETRALGSAAVTEEVLEGAEETMADIDDLLNEIDDVLEVNAEEFVKSYIQKGGE